MKVRRTVALAYVVGALIAQVATAAGNVNPAAQAESTRVIWLAVMLMLSLVCAVLVALLWRERQQERRRERGE